MKLKRANKPAHGLMGSPREIKPLKAGAHVPPRTNTGNSDHKGYQDSQERRMGKIPTKLGPSDSRKRQGPEGDGNGSPPGGKGGASLAAHKGTAGRGGKGVIGQSDGWKGKAQRLPDDITSKQFEKLGAG